MSRILAKAAGIALLIATIGIASCQALWVGAPVIGLPLG